MKKDHIMFARILTYAGTLPLIACTISVYFPETSIDSILIATTYSAIIISFLCGIHWAVYLFFSDKCPRNLLVTSNLVALLAWASLLMPDRLLAIVLQALCFLYLLTLDLKLRDAGVLPIWFYALRRNATIIVVLSLALLMRHL